VHNVKTELMMKHAVQRFTSLPPLTRGPTSDIGYDAHTHTTLWKINLPPLLLIMIDRATTKDLHGCFHYRSQYSTVTVLQCRRPKRIAGGESIIRLNDGSSWTLGHTSDTGIRYACRLQPCTALDAIFAIFVT